MNFNMSIEDNFASFIDEETGTSIFIDSFDNEEFEVRIGTLQESQPAGSVIAHTTEELNTKLAALYQNFQGEK
ncbi:hypothetical protein [Simiduia agarivorans]|uniref:Uncharacterized protein n=1 Tax=Simiduia agarivorans (strain DSM 21679 / JCM 13881 / BCRC 17597 / SA1) TaxID=1117647 RepID=K4KRK4_SIMAS|nr:hypothetical protein [Simiduia agarivorans]AFV00926.1 hypothetical protein M5M_18985 [Simiduia agarivorans SA1 = DSM 21679]